MIGPLLVIRYGKMLVLLVGELVVNFPHVEITACEHFNYIISAYVEITCIWANLLV
jgi:hypothetical protein